MENRIHMRSYAKINLALDVLGRRKNGYHDVRMIMQSFNLSDSLTMERTTQKGITLTTSLPDLPSDENNLVVKAVSLIKEAYHIKDGLKIYLEKNIPVAAGLAGGSSNGAAALKGMNELFQLGLSLEELMKLGIGLGADIPYCLLGGTALSEGIGEKLTPLPDLPETLILVVKPAVRVSTRYVYEHLDLTALENRPDIDQMIAAIKEQDLYKVSGLMGNVLESVTIKDHPVIEKIKKDILWKGALGALMSGSGPTVFGLFNDSKKIAAAESCLKQKYPDYTIKSCKTIKGDF